MYALGGDGTLNEVVNGVAGQGGGGLLPSGLRQRLCQAVWAVQLALPGPCSALVTAQPHALDLIECNGRLAINICSVGFDARIGLGMADYKRLAAGVGPGGVSHQPGRQTPSGAFTGPMSWNWMGSGFPATLP